MNWLASQPATKQDTGLRRRSSVDVRLCEFYQIQHEDCDADPDPCVHIAVRLVNMASVNSPSVPRISPT